MTMPTANPLSLLRSKQPINSHAFLRSFPLFGISNKVIPQMSTSICQRGGGGGGGDRLLLLLLRDNGPPSNDNQLLVAAWRLA